MMKVSKVERVEARVARRRSEGEVEGMWVRRGGRRSVEARRGECDGWRLLGGLWSEVKESKRGEEREPKPMSPARATASEGWEAFPRRRRGKELVCGTGSRALVAYDRLECSRAPVAP